MQQKILKHRFTFLVCTAIFLFILNVGAFGQEKQLKFNTIAGAEDINLGKINAITQDKYGFIWLSAQNNRSIIRYDGTNMVQIMSNPDDPNDPKALGGNYPECFFTDESGILWIGFYGQGLDRYDLTTETFVHYDNNPSDPKSLANDYVTDIHRDRFGNLWIGTYGGLDLFDEQSGTFIHHKRESNNPSSLSSDSVRVIYEDKSGTLWIGAGLPWEPNSNGGLNRYNREKNNFISYLHEPNNPASLINNKVRALLEDSYGNFWVGTAGDGLHTMDRETGKFTRHTFDPEKPNKLSRPPVINPNQDHITFIKEDVEKNIWIGTDQNGINRFNPLAKTLTHFGEEVDMGAWCMYVSSDNQQWITTNQNRLLKVSLNYTQIPTYYGQLRRKYKESDSVMWFGTEKGLIKKTQKGSNSVMKFYPSSTKDSGPKDKKWNNFSEEPINYEITVPMFKDEQGRIMFRGNMDFKFNLLDPNTGMIKAYSEEDTLSLDNYDVSQIFSGQDSIIWISTWGNGLWKIDRKNKQTQRFVNDLTNGRSLSSNVVFNMLTDSEKNLWLATANGIQRYNPETNDFNSFLLGTVTYQILTDSKGVLWAATINGVFFYDASSNKFLATKIKVPEFSIYEDEKDESLWFGSEMGVYKINALRNYISYFEMEAKNEANTDRNNYWTISEGYSVNDKIYLGGAGLYPKYYVFDSEKLTEPKTSSIPYFAELWLSEELIEPGPNSPIKSSIDKLRSLKLPNDQNIFSISFGIIDFQDRYENEIYYMLEGFDLDWKKTTPNERIGFFKIPAGNYFLKIKSANPNGTWNQKQLEVIIAPPFYLTSWAYFIYFLMLCVVAFVIHRIQKARVLRQERERNKDRELAQAREIEKAYTELKATQAQLIQSEKMASLGELTAGIAHEIQNPLNFVNNFSEVSKELLDEMKTELNNGNTGDAIEIADDVIQNLEKINHHGKRADSIVKGMLQHSRSSTGIKEPTDINSLSDEYLRLAYHGLRAKDKSFNADFKSDFDKKIGKINVVPQDIGRVILNLLNNAFYAVREKKKMNIEDYKPLVSIQTKNSKNNVEITISDNGNGIPLEVLDKIYQPFFTTKPTGEGTGLGLSMSYEIITKGHHGELIVNTKENRGTEFRITLPKE